MPPDLPASDHHSHNDPPVEDRLDSWKEIAAFLKRDVRTVQRWEKHAGLPVHRHAQSRLRTAYAYRSELEAWWHSYRATAAFGAMVGQSIVDGHEIVAVAAAAPNQLRKLAVGGALAVLVGAFVWLGLHVPVPQASLNQVDTRVSVLVVDFNNDTGEPGRDRLLKEEVTHQLARHPRLRVLSPARVTRLLQLMKRTPDASITPEVGRELALRDGSVSSLVAGRVRKSNDGYYLDLELIDPEEGTLLVGEERHVRTERDLFVICREQADAIARRLLQNAAPHRQRQRLEDVSTPSLPAVRLYSQARDAGMQREWAASELLVRQALASDPGFAAGHAWLAVTLRNQGHPPDECLAIARRAVALSGGGTDYENYLISGTFFDLQGDVTKALGAYEALLRVAPGDARTLDLLVNGYSRVGRFGTAVEYAVARADARRDDFYGNVRAAHALFTWQSDPRRAQPFVRRATSLLTTRTGVERPEWKAWLRVLPVFESWLAGGPSATRTLLEPLAGDLSQTVGRERDALATAVGSSYLALGLLEQAERAFRFASAPVRQFNLAALALTLDDAVDARDALRQVGSVVRERPVVFAAAGLVGEAAAGLASLSGSDYREGIQAVTRGLIAEQGEHFDEAITWLRTGTDLLRVSGELEYFVAVRRLARILVNRGDERRAVRLLEEATQQRARTYGSVSWAGGLWIATANDLLALLEPRGHRDAEQVRRILRGILTHADANHPVLRTIGAVTQ